MSVIQVMSLLREVGNKGKVRNGMEKRTTGISLYPEYARQAKAIWNEMEVRNAPFLFYTFEFGVKNI